MTGIYWHNHGKYCVFTAHKVRSGSWCDDMDNRSLSFLLLNAANKLLWIRYRLALKLVEWSSLFGDTDKCFIGIHGILRLHWKYSSQKKNKTKCFIEVLHSKKKKKKDRAPQSHTKHHYVTISTGRLLLTIKVMFMYKIGGVSLWDWFKFKRTFLQCRVV